MTGPAKTRSLRSGGHCLVECLAAQGVERVFCVPGESYLDVLDGLYDAEIDTVVTRHESGAAMMAEAEGKMSGRPGIALVTRGPGATNASAGVHIAQQDSTPMILFVGQIGRDMRGREAFQEVDYRQMFGGLAKWVDEIDRADRIPEVLAHAWHVAMSGRPGPVVLALPEDMLLDQTDAPPARYIEVAEPAPTASTIAAAAEHLRNAERPIIIAGGSRWTRQAYDDLQAVAENAQIPVGVSFRRQNLFDAGHANYAGDVGLGINPRLKQSIADADVVCLLGCRFSENPSQAFSLLDIPNPVQTLMHVHPGPEELGRIYTPHVSINATPGQFLTALIQSDIKPDKERLAHVNALSKAYHDWSDAPPEGIGVATLSRLVSELRDRLPGDAILTNGAGNYAIWLHRFFRFAWERQLAPTSGSMGYGLPAAIAAACHHPDRKIVCWAGDGCFQMTGMEFGVAVQRNLNITVLVCDNAQYGTIRMHQARTYPGRQVATSLKNPDFAAWAQSYGALGLTVSSDTEMPAKLQQALDHKGPSLVHLKIDPRDISPVLQLSGTE